MYNLFKETVKAMDSIDRSQATYQDMLLKNDEIELPKSIFLLPEGTEIEDIKLIPVNGDFRNWDKVQATYSIFIGKLKPEVLSDIIRRLVN